MKRIKKITADVFLTVIVSLFLFSCASLEQQTQKDVPPAPPPPPVKAEEVKPPPPPPPPPAKEDVLKLPPAAQKQAEPPPAVKPQVPKALPAPPGGAKTQQKYYDMGMRYYAQEKYAEAKKAWQRVIKLGRRTDLAKKARENIKKVDQILKTLKEMSGR